MFYRNRVKLWYKYVIDIENIVYYLQYKLLLHNYYAILYLYVPLPSTYILYNEHYNTFDPYNRPQKAELIICSTPANTQARFTKKHRYGDEKS